MILFNFLFLPLFRDFIFYVFDEISASSDFALCVSTNLLPSDFPLLMSLSITIVTVRNFETSENRGVRNSALFTGQIWFFSYM